MKVYGALEVAQIEWFTDAGKPAASAYPYRIIYVTDLKQLQVSDGSNWNPFVVNEYTTAGFPTASTANKNQLAYDSTLRILYFSNGTTWIPLNPMTTAGDIVYGGVNGIPTRLANGLSGQFLKSNGGSSAPSWDSISVTNAFTSVTTTYSILTSDSTILCSDAGGSFTVTLPSAVSISGKQFVIKKTNSSSNIVTIATSLAQTIDGASTLVLGSQNDSVIVQSDGSNFRVISDSIKISASYTISAATQAVGANGIIDFNNKIFDSHNAVTTGASWRFTAPRNGRFRLSGYAYHSSGVNTVLLLSKNGTVIRRVGYLDATVTNAIVSTTVDLLAGEYIEIRSLNAYTVVGTSSSVAYSFIDISSI